MKQISTADVRVKRLITLGKSRPIIHQKLTQEPDTNIDKENNHIEKARQFFHENLFACFVGMLSGLYCLMFIPSIVKVLHSTGKSGDPKKAFNRYLMRVYITHILSEYKIFSKIIMRTIFFE